MRGLSGKKVRIQKQLQSGYKMKQNEKLINFTLDKELARLFDVVAQSKHKNRTTLLREYIINEINKYAKQIKEQNK